MRLRRAKKNDILRVFIYLSFCISAIYSGNVVAEPLDSIGVERSVSGIIVMHKVVAGETLFSIARRYKASVADIKTANPGIENGLKVGSIIKVPKSSKTSEPSTKADTKAKVKQHTVSAGQSLFGIARTYKVSVADLKRWNNLEDRGLKQGMQIYVQDPASQSPENQKSKVVTIAPNPKKVDSSGYTVKDPGGFERFKEHGIAEIIEEQKPGRKHLCLHKMAPIGSIVKVKNEANGAVIFVRVIGKLPETGENEKVVVKLTKSAFRQLNAQDSRIPVEVSYTKQ